MRPSTDLDRRLTAWLDEDAQVAAPDRLLSEALARTHGVRPRPGWRITERWIPMRVSMALAVIPRAVLLMLALLALLALAASAYVVGSPGPSPLPAPMGPARNGLLAWDSGGDIWVSRTDGSDRRRLTSGPERDVSPIWSRDGTRIAFWSAPTTTADGYGVDFSVPQMSLVVIEADGSDRRTLADGISFDGVDMEFSWAPDGHAIVFARDAGTRTVVTVAPLDGSPLRDIADGETPRWSPDGSLIAYRSGPPPLAVMAVSEDGLGQVRLTRSAGSSEAFWMPSWSPDGSSLVAFSGRSGAHDIVVVERDGSAERVLADTFRDEYWPVWGPTDRIVFSRVLGSQNRPTFVLIDPDGDNERVLDGLLPEWPGAAATWSPDGALLLGGDFDADEPGTFVLHLIDPTGVAPEESLPIAQNVGIVSWQRLAP